MSGGGFVPNLINAAHSLGITPPSVPEAPGPLPAGTVQLGADPYAPALRLGPFTIDGTALRG